MIAIIQTIRDLLIRFLPIRLHKYDFAFLVHSRDLTDIHWKFPFTRRLSDKLVLWLAKHYWPVVVAEITGLKSLIDGRLITGVTIGFPMTAHQMMEERTLVLKKIIQSANLAYRLGAKIIGLGGLTSSLSKGGLDLLGRVDIGITTGHAYTAHTVAQNVFRAASEFGLSKEGLIAIGGAAGSIGSTTAQILAREGYNNLILIDLPRKVYFFDELKKKMSTLNSRVKVETSSHLSDVSRADLIVTATNAPEAVIRADYLKPGVIIVDDAQPSDISPEVLNLDEAVVIGAGAVNTPGIHNNFNFGFKNRFDNFCCLCEVMILAANGWDDHYVINRADLKQVNHIVELGEKLGFRLSQMQNYKEVIPKSKIDYVRELIRKRK